MTDLHVHLVFLTVRRRGALTDSMLTRCRLVMGEVCTDFGADLVGFTGAEDHVRLHVRYPATVSVTRLVNSLKGVSSRLVRKEFKSDARGRPLGEQLWSPSYYAGSSAEVPEPVLSRYLDSQRLPDP